MSTLGTAAITSKATIVHCGKAYCGMAHCDNAQDEPGTLAIQDLVNEREWCDAFVIL